MVEPPGHQVELLQEVPVCLVLGSPNLGTVLHTWSDKCWMEWKKNHFPWLASYTSASTAWDLFGLLLQDKCKCKKQGLQSEVEILWLAFVHVQLSCPSLPRKSASLGRGAFWTGSSTEGSWSLLKVCFNLPNDSFKPVQTLAWVSTQMQNRSGFSVLLLISWSRALRTNLWRNMTSFIILALAAHRALEFANVILKQMICLTLSAHLSDSSCFYSPSQFLPSICSCFCHLQSPLFQLLI